MTRVVVMGEVGGGEGGEAAGGSARGEGGGVEIEGDAALVAGVTARLCAV